MSRIVNISPSSQVSALPLGVVLSKYYFENTDYFDTFGLGGQSIVNGKVRLTTSGGVNYNNGILIDKPNALTNFKMTIQYTVVSAISGASYGIALGLKSANSFSEFDCCVAHNMLNSGDPRLFILGWDNGTDYAILSTITTDVDRLQNARYKLTYEMQDYKIKVRCERLGSDQESEGFFMFSYDDDFIPPNTSNFAIYNVGGTYDIESIHIETTDFKNAKLLCIGDSKTEGIGANALNTGFPNILKDFYEGVSKNAGTSDTTIEVIIKIDQIIQLSPQKVLLNIGSNDKRFGRTFSQWSTDYDSIVSQLEAANIDVYHLLQLNENSLTFNDYNSHINTTYDASRIINAGTIALAADGIHPSQEGMQQIADAVISKNFVSI